MKNLQSLTGLLLLSATLIFTSGCKINLTKNLSIGSNRSATKLRTWTMVNSIRVPDKTSTDKNLSSVAGPISVGQNASIRNVKTTAGPIRIGDHTSTRDLRSLAGNITIGANVNVHGKVHTTAGNIHISDGTQIAEDVSSTAGSITLDHCFVEGEVRAKYGSLTVRGAKLSGGILAKKVKKLREQKPIQINIESGSIVASVTAEENSFAELRISKSAEVGEIVGIDAEYY